MQFNRLAVVSRDETEVLGYQLQVTATKEEWETIDRWCDTVLQLQCADEQVKVFHEMLMGVLKSG